MDDQETPSSLIINILTGKIQQARNDDRIEPNDNVRQLAVVFEVKLLVSK